ncbi:hypothetical protein ACTA71_009678 [Dictyostelium dimigraforme]
MKIIILIIIVKVLLIIDISYCINQLPNNNDYIYLIKQWEYLNCTGEQVEFLAFGENQFYTELMDSFFICDPTISPISCNFTVNYNNQNITDKKTIELKEGICNSFKTIEYIKSSDFDYNESKYCVMSEYSTCQYKPIFHMGTLRDVCVYGWLLKCSALGYEIKHCKLLDYNDTSNYTILDGGKTDIFPAYICKNSIENVTSSSRGYIVHASTIDGINDPQYDQRIIKLGPKSNHHFLNSSQSTFLISFKKIIVSIFLIIFITL